MKTLILNGSPRKNGDTQSLLDALTPRLGGETLMVRAYDEGIAPCVDCRWCWTHEGCCVNDGMQDVYAFLRDCDAVVIGSPVYFSELTGRLLDVGSRLQTYFSAKYLRHEPTALSPKRGGVILVGGGDGSADKAQDTAQTLLHLMNAKQLFPLVLSHDTDHVPAAKDGQALSQIEQLAAFLRGEPR